METIMNRPEEKVTLKYPVSKLEDNHDITFTILGQNPERSYEDRSVYFAMKSEVSPEVGVCMGTPVDFTMWLNGEDAIELGVKLIEQGKYALEANMIQHQAIHTERQFQTYLSEDRIEEVVFEVTNDSPDDHGQGFRTYLITPYWKSGMTPTYDADFSYEKIIYWSPFEDKYADQLDYYTQGTSYSFIGYDHEEEVRLFDLACIENQDVVGPSDVFEVQAVEE